MNKILETTLDEQFPKGKCKERGQALLLHAIAQLELERKDAEELEFLEKAILNECNCEACKNNNPYWKRIATLKARTKQ